jgi:hypothetical protein
VSAFTTTNRVRPSSGSSASRTCFFAHAASALGQRRVAVVERGKDGRASAADRAAPVGAPLATPAPPQRGDGRSAAPPSPTAVNRGLVASCKPRAPAGCGMKKVELEVSQYRRIALSANEAVPVDDLVLRGIGCG